MFSQNIAISFFFCLWLSFSSFANLITYQIATPSPQGGLGLEFIWPLNGEQCLDRAMAEEALERSCEEAKTSSILMLVQVSSDGEIRTQKTLRILRC